MSSLDIAPHPESAPTRVRDLRRMRHRLRVSFRRAGNCTIWRLGFRQFSFHHIARVPRRTVPDTWTRPPVSCHALIPLTFRRQVRHRTQGHPSNPSRLHRGYNEAPRGAPLLCRESRGYSRLKCQRVCMICRGLSRRVRHIGGYLCGQSPDCARRSRWANPAGTASGRPRWPGPAAALAAARSWCSHRAARRSARRR